MSAETVRGEPRLQDVKMHLLKPVSPGIGVVARNERCTASKKAAGYVRHIEIDVSGTPLAGECWPGQSLGVIPEGADAHGKPHKVRLYSLSSPRGGCDGEGKIQAITVKRVIDEHWDDHRLFLGAASNYLCDRKPGDKITITGPAGKRFVLPAEPGAHDYLFIATGTGIAPYRGMVIDLLGKGCPSTITLIMGAPYSSDLIYHDFFLDMAAKHPNFTYLTAISRERGEGSSGMYVQDRLRAGREQLLPQLASERNLIYICGLAGMELGIFQQLATILPGDALEQYLRVDPAASGDPTQWDRRMIHKGINPTRRIMMEVYD